jgi:NAD(P)-dependent dehydrogenase (short-subunit alcohol dehydrogenase family)
MTMNATAATTSDLTGTVAIVTGASRGFGRAVLDLARDEGRNGTAHSVTAQAFEQLS